MGAGSGDLFYSKILLFGEYSLMFGSMALSIPFRQFSGRFIKNHEWQAIENGKFSNHHLRKYAAWLESMHDQLSGTFTIDVERFKKDVEEGLVFRSNIPKGYGLGSSGALVAAVYTRYGSPLLSAGTDPSQMLVLKNFLAGMESCFHGKSSGLDPLICYLKNPILIESDGTLSTTQLPEWPGDSMGAVFLIDSGLSGETQPLVDSFIRRCRDESFKDAIRSEYIPLVDASLKAYCQNNPGRLMEKLQHLSAMQWEYFDEMIPSSVHTAWKNGLESKQYVLKLCGSGGGGMMLGFTRDYTKAKDLLGGHNFTFVHPL